MKKNIKIISMSLIFLISSISISFLFINVKAGKEYPTDISSTYIYAGGYSDLATPVCNVTQYWQTNLTLKNQVVYANLAGQNGTGILDMLEDNNYIYAGGHGINTLRKYYKSNLTALPYEAVYRTIDGDLYTGIRSLAQDNTYVYVGGFHNLGIKRYWKSNLTYKDGAAYGDKVYVMDIDSTYLYAGGKDTNRVYKYLLSDLSYVTQSALLGNVYALAVDDTYIYAAGGSGLVEKLLKSDLTNVLASTNHGATIWMIAQDDTYIYYGGEGNIVYQCWKSNLTEKASTVNYGATVYGIEEDNTYLYVAYQSAVGKIYKFWKSNLTTTSIESASYGGSFITIASLNETSSPTSNGPQFLSISSSSNGTILYNATPTFNWTIVSNTSRYQLQISTTSSFADTDLVVNLTNVSEINFASYYDENSTRVSFTLPTINSLSSYNRYYCRVRAFYRS